MGGSRRLRGRPRPRRRDFGLGATKSGSDGRTPSTRRAVKAFAFYDGVAFNDFWDRVEP